MAAKAKPRKQTNTKQSKVQAGKTAKQPARKVKPAISRPRTVPDMVGAVTV
jgi:hypothetical protein